MHVTPGFGAAPRRFSPGRWRPALSPRRSRRFARDCAWYARALGVSINTVKYHLASVFTKLDARTRAEAVSAAARRGDLML